MLIEDVHLPRIAHRALLTLSASRARLALEKERFVQATDTAISELLRGMRLSVRDTAELLGLSHQRVQQLKVASLAAGRRGTGLRERPHD
ncbi:MAG TPA: hypothetical protein VFD38_10495 [Myxococcaceae bacterium]|nr:hypothetical protein [Myxococcaceae bacterium]